jgi:HK97 family phage major capsid protein
MILGAQKFSSRMVPISFQLIRDSGIPLAPRIGTMLGERLGRTMARMWAFGSGRGVLPRGIGRDAPVAYALAKEGQIAYTDIINFEGEVEPDYRGDGACILLHDRMRQQLRLMEDGQGRPMWLNTWGDLKEGAPDRFAGYNIQRVQEMPYDYAGHCIDGTINPQLLIMGMIKLYYIREVQTIRILRLKERAAERDQELFLAFMEADGGLLNAGTYPVKALCDNGGTLGRVRFQVPGTRKRSTVADLQEGALHDPRANDPEAELDEANAPPREVSAEAKAEALAAVQEAIRKGKK